MSKGISNIKVAGFFRLNIINHEEDGSTKVVGDSGWKKNLVTNLGFQHYFIEPAAAIAGSSQVSYFALGLGTAPAATDTSLQSELTDAAGCRFTMTPSVVSSKTLQMLGTLASNIITANRTIQNVGVFAVSTISAGSMLCGNTYSTSQLQSNQSVNITYQLRFATA
jgi:hypothetical protein